MALLNGARVSELELQVPPVGGWFVSARLQTGAMPTPGPATLVVGNLPLPGRILDRGGLDSPATPAVVIAGGYGWRTKLPAGLYTSPKNVRLSLVLADLARLCGEAYDAPAEAHLGPEYGWQQGTRGRAVLADLVARGAFPLWRVDPATGRTRFDAWPTLGAADAKGVIVDRDLARGIRYVDLDTEASAWLPGATVQGVRIARSIYREADSKLRVEVWES